MGSENFKYCQFSRPKVCWTLGEKSGKLSDLAAEEAKDECFIQRLEEVSKMAALTDDFDTLKGLVRDPKACLDTTNPECLGPLRTDDGARCRPVPKQFLYDKAGTLEMGSATGTGAARGKKLVVVLGPSASGKTTTTALLLPMLVRENGWDCDQGFYTIDGGLMRMVSPLYYAAKTAVQDKCASKKPACEGSSDLYGLTKSGHGDLKKQLFEKYMREGRNIIYLDTATSFGGITVDLRHGFHLKAKTVASIREASRSGYSISVVFIYSSKAQCAANAAEREKEEGKIYTGDGSWNWAISNGNEVLRLMRDEHLSDGNRQYVVNNTDVALPTAEKVVAAVTTSEAKIKVDCHGGILTKCSTGATSASFYVKRRNSATNPVTDQVKKARCSTPALVAPAAAPNPGQK